MELNPELYSELSLNLLKLEKVCLQEHTAGGFREEEEPADDTYGFRSRETCRDCWTRLLREVTAAA